MTTAPQATREAAARALGWDTLDTRRSDSLDFHEVHRATLKEAVHTAWIEAGGTGDLPAHLHPATHPATAFAVTAAAGRGGSAADFPEVAVWAVDDLVGEAYAAGARELTRYRSRGFAAGDR